MNSYQECLWYYPLHWSLSLCLCSYRKVAYFSSRADAPKLDRRRGFSNGATAAMFIATTINFLLCSLVTGTQVALFVASTRTALILNIDYPLSEKLELVKKVVWNLDIALDWAGSTPVSTTVQSGYQIAHLTMLREDAAHRSHGHLEGLGPLPRSTVGNPPTIYFVDRSRR